MEILNFIFLLGINFSIFGFIWGVIILGTKLLRGPVREKRQTQDYIIRIVKYFLLVSVTANFVVVNKGSDLDGNVAVSHMVIGTIVLALYLLGKLQNRAMMSQLAQNPMLARFTNQIDPKVERFLLLGSVVYFVICLMVPAMVDNFIVNWFSGAILSIYNAVIIGWIFKIIGFFFLVNILLRASNVIGNILTGQPINSRPKSRFGGFQQGGGAASNPFEQFREQQQNDEGFTDYEDVTEEEEKDNTKGLN
ncbi:hypothetical protein [Crocinitomix catalasitica]|uniref:hypothetical protein n=1 Tax=Crocinitomix catalasitica TaxID=184607 RepID=UPI000486842D|nr:hypothetical protein [Crocinitomix catalasitica]